MLAEAVVESLAVNMPTAKYRKSFSKLKLFAQKNLLFLSVPIKFYESTRNAIERKRARLAIGVKSICQKTEEPLQWSITNQLGNNSVIDKNAQTFQATQRVPRALMSS